MPERGSHVNLRPWLAARRLILLAMIATVVVLAPAGAARAEGPNAIESDAGCTAHTLNANDDNSTGPVSLGFTFNFFGNSYTNVYVNNNGNVTFAQALGTYTPYDFTTGGDPVIAPFLADVDTRGAGSGLVTYGTTTRDGHNAFCVNWVDVGYYENHTDKKNSFQLFIVDLGSGNSQIVMNYDKVQWETGDFSGGNGGLGGTSAAMGFTNGDGDPSHSFMQGGSFTNGALLDSNTGTGLIYNNAGTTQAGRYIFAVNSGTPGPKLTGEVKKSNGDPAASAPVEICPNGGGACITRNTDASGHYRASGLDGTYNLTAHPPSSSADTDGHAGPVTIHQTDTTDTTQDIDLGPPLPPPPPDTSITSIDTGPNGVPIAYWGDPLTIQTEGCVGGTATYELRVEGQLISSGSMSEGPAGHYSVTVPAVQPHHGNSAVHIAIDCPTPSDNETTDFGLYIDPSGVVKDSQGAAVGDATVTLYRSSSPDGPFIPVPDGSAVMSPSNRSNPSATLPDGRFAWDVVAGYYFVRASKDGCVSAANHSVSYAESAVLTIPPPVTNLDLRLFCGEGATSAGSGGPVNTTTPPGPLALVSPASTLLPSNAFTIGKKVKAAKNGSVTLTLTVPGPGKIVAQDGTGVKATVAAAAKKKKSKKAKTLIKKVTKNVTKAGKVTIVITPSADGLKALKKKGKLKVKVAVTYTPTGGKARTVITTVTLKRPKKK